MSNQDIEWKRRIFLEELKKGYSRKFQIFNFKKFSGPGIKKKILKLIFAPHIYIPYIYVPYIFMKMGFYKKGRIKKINLFWGRKIYVRKELESFMSLRFGFLPGELEIKLTKFFIKNLKEDDIFYDVGANYGFYTYLALEFCKEVHSFEPLPHVFQCLEMTLKDIPNVFLNNIALSDKEGETEMFLPFSSGISTILKDRTKKLGVFSTITVKTTTLDKYISNGKAKPTVIKLDVEGAESLVIEGGIEFFKNNNPIIVMEVWSKEEGYEISMKAVEKLKNLGYKPYFINLDGELEKIEGDLISKIKESAENFVFLKNI